MNRRKFFANSVVFGVGSALHFQAMPLYIASSGSPRIGLKRLLDEGNLKRMELSQEIKTCLSGISKYKAWTFPTYGYKYGDNYIVETRKSNIIPSSSEEGLVFLIRADLGRFKTVLLEKDQCDVLDNLAISYMDCLEDRNLTFKASDFLLPDKINERNDSGFSYRNKLGNYFRMIKKKNRQRIIIS